jgi:hypothetical protein
MKNKKCSDKTRKEIEDKIQTYFEENMKNEINIDNLLNRLGRIKPDKIVDHVKEINGSMVHLLFIYRDLLFIYNVSSDYASCLSEAYNELQTI